MTLLRFFQPLLSSLFARVYYYIWCQRRCWCCGAGRYAPSRCVVNSARTENLHIAPRASYLCTVGRKKRQYRLRRRHPTTTKTN